MFNVARLHRNIEEVVSMAKYSDEKIKKMRDYVLHYTVSYWAKEVNKEYSTLCV
jgi:hypothetical protein